MMLCNVLFWMALSTASARISPSSRKLVPLTDISIRIVMEIIFASSDLERNQCLGVMVLELPASTTGMSN